WQTRPFWQTELSMHASPRPAKFEHVLSADAALRLQTNSAAQSSADPQGSPRAPGFEHWGGSNPLLQVKPFAQRRSSPQPSPTAPYAVQLPSWPSHWKKESSSVWAPAQYKPLSHWLSHSQPPPGPWGTLGTRQAASEVKSSAAIAECEAAFAARSLI